MKIIYYYVLYLKKENDIEIHAKPFTTKSAAEDYQKKSDAHFGDRVYFSKIKKVDVSKYDKEIWL